MRLGRAAAAASCAVTLMCCAPAGARAAPAPSFNGDCDFGGLEALFSPALSAKQVDVVLDIAGPGECTGLLDGVSVQHQVTVLAMHVAGRAGCEGTDGFLPGTASLRFGSVEIPLDARFDLQTGLFIRVALAGATGTASGTGLPLGTVGLTPQQTLDYDAGCVTGTGCDVVGVDCKTQRRAAIEFDAHTGGTTLTSISSPQPALVSAPALRTPKLTTLLVSPRARGCRSKQLRFSVPRAWRRKVASFDVRTRGVTTTAPSDHTIVIRRSRTRSLLAHLEVRLRDGRKRTGARRFAACA